MKKKKQKMKKASFMLFLEKPCYHFLSYNVLAL